MSRPNIFRSFQVCCLAKLFLSGARGILRHEGVRAMIKFRLHKVAADRDVLKIGAMAERARLSPQTVSGIWNNHALRIDLATLNALCTALHCTPGDLLEYVPETAPRTRPSGRLRKSGGERK